MKKDSIIHFVGFTTRLASPSFIHQWTRYAQQMSCQPDAVLREQTKGKGRYQYISQHESKDEGFRFSFTKAGASENFPERSARIIMLGGYSPVMISQKDSNNWDAKVLMFLTGSQLTNHSYYQSIRSLNPNIYEPYYENCLYTNILEFTAGEREAMILAEWLSGKNEDADISIYSRCETPDLVS